MKRSILFLFLAVGIASFAQTVSISEKPTSNWPFFFQDFEDATIFLNDDNKSTTKTKVNINFFSGELQYLDASQTIRILQNTEDIKLVKVGEDLQFVFVDGSFQYLLFENDTYFISKRAKAKVSDVQEQSGAYGSSTQSQAVDNINQKLIGGINNFNYASLIDTRTDGTSFEPDISYYLVGDDFEISLTKRNLKNTFEVDSKKIFSFMKKEKISLKDEKDLSLLLDFISQL